MKNLNLTLGELLGGITSIFNVKESCVMGFKPHLAVDDRGKIIVWRLTKGSKYDILEAENLLKGRTETAIGDRDYCSKALREQLAERNLRFIAHARHNMKESNTLEEKELLKKRNLVERFILSLPLLGSGFRDDRARHNCAKSRSMNFATGIHLFPTVQTNTPIQMQPAIRFSDPNPLISWANVQAITC